MAGLIVMDPLGATKARHFHQFMAGSGDLKVQNKHYPKMQMLSVPEILEGKVFKTPGAVGRGLAQPSLPLG